jgi:BioD-like phosphotransacetylase family protein
VPADRTEVLLGLLLANSSGTFPSIAGIILNGPFPLPPAVQDLMVGSTRRCRSSRPTWTPTTPPSGS